MSRVFQSHGSEQVSAVREDSRPDTPRGTVWIRCDPSVPHMGLWRALREVPAYQGVRPCNDVLALAICCPDGDEDLARTLPALAEDARGAPVVVFGASASLPLAREALQAGARGFLHAHMPPEHIARALRLAEDGEVVLPRELLNSVVEEARGPELPALTARQTQILKLVSEGLANAQVAGRLYVSESTVKQHLHAAYKIMGVRNRVAAAAMFRRSKLAQRDREHLQVIFTS